VNGIDMISYILSMSNVISFAPCSKPEDPVPSLSG